MNILHVGPCGIGLIFCLFCVKRIVCRLFSPHTMCQQNVRLNKSGTFHCQNGAGHTNYSI